jgi:uncharacterized membrane protein YuzA (DUF378 family)
MKGLNVPLFGFIGFNITQFPLLTILPMAAYCVVGVWRQTLILFGKGEICNDRQKKEEET